MGRGEKGGRARRRGEDGQDGRLRVCDALLFRCASDGFVLPHHLHLPGRGRVVKDGEGWGRVGKSGEGWGIVRKGGDGWTCAAASPAPENARSRARNAVPSPFLRAPHASARPRGGCRSGGRVGNGARAARLSRERALAGRCVCLQVVALSAPQLPFYSPLWLIHEINITVCVSTGAGSLRAPTALLVAPSAPPLPFCSPLWPLGACLQVSVAAQTLLEHQ